MVDKGFFNDIRREIFDQMVMCILRPDICAAVVRKIFSEECSYDMTHNGAFMGYILRHLTPLCPSGHTG